jgi:hypothetical protein
LRQIYVKNMTIEQKPRKTKISPFDRGISVKVHKIIGPKKITLRSVQRILSGQTKQDDLGVMDVAIRLQKAALKRKKRTQDRFQLLKLYR